MNPFLVNRVRALRMFLSLSPMVAAPNPRNATECCRSLLHRSQYDAVYLDRGDDSLRTQDGAQYSEDLGGAQRNVTLGARRYDRASGITQRVRCWVSWRKSRWYEGRMYPRFDLVTMVSEVDRQSTLSSVGADRVVVAVVPNGVDCDPILALRSGNQYVGLQRRTYLQR